MTAIENVFLTAKPKKIVLSVRHVFKFIAMQHTGTIKLTKIYTEIHKHFFSALRQNKSSVNRKLSPVGQHLTQSTSLLHHIPQVKTYKNKQMHLLVIITLVPEYTLRNKKKSVCYLRRMPAQHTYIHIFMVTNDYLHLVAATRD